MKQKTLALSVALLLGGAVAQAQTDDVTFTVAPSTGYTWWSKNVNLGESAHWGVRAGFSFGRMFEIRGVYDRSFDLKGKLASSRWNLVSTLGDKLEGSSASMERLGGEMRLSLLQRTALIPYLTAGGGVMTLKHDALVAGEEAYKEEQLYAALGAGLKLRLTDRVGLSLEAKNHLFSLAEGSHYRNPYASPGRVLNNWSAQASLDVYLGGAKADNDPISRAYRDLYSGGMRGLKFTFEPGLSYLDFHNSSLMHDQWMVGGALGVDFTNTLGLRGFYYTSTQTPNKLDLNLNTNVQMYGASILGRLNYLRGLTPYVTLGGGFMDVRTSSYLDTRGTNEARSGWFAMGGAGLEIPLHRYVSVYGNVNLLFLERDHAEVRSLYTPSQVNFSTMYQAGVRINIGSSAKSGKALYRDFATSAVAREETAHQEYINQLRAEQEERIVKLSKGYNERISALDQELMQAVAERDTLRVLQLSSERKQVEQDQVQLLSTEAQLVEDEDVAHEVPLTRLQVAEPARKIVTLSQAQLEELIARVVEQVGSTKSQSASLSTLSDLDKILLFTALSNGQLQQTQLQGSTLIDALGLSTQRTERQESARTEELAKLQERTEQLLEKVEALQKQIEEGKQAEHYRAIERQYLQSSTEGVRQPLTVLQPAMSVQGSTEGEPESLSIITVDERGRVAQKEYTLQPKSALSLEAVQVFTGLNVGDGFSWVLGARPQWQIKESQFYFAPEAFYGFGGGAAFGLSANALYKLGTFKGQSFSPYVGLGLGYTRIHATSRLNTNVILGASLDKVLGGKLTVDYTVRGLFRNNQFAVGYTIKL